MNYKTSSNRGFGLLGFLVTLGVALALFAALMITIVRHPMSPAQNAADRYGVGETPSQKVVNGTDSRTSDVGQTPAATEPPDANTGSSIDTSDWKTYRNTKYGYELKYPPQNWYPDNLRGLPLSETDDAFLIAKVINEKDTYIEQSRLYMRFFVSVIPNPNTLTAKEWSFFGVGLNFPEGPDPSLPMSGETLQDYKQRATGVELPHKNDAAKSIVSATTFLGIPAIETTAEQWESLLFPRNEHIVLTSWSVIDGREKPVVARKIFNQILSTFKFIE